MKFINLTPHDVNVLIDGQPGISIPGTDNPLRLTEQYVLVKKLDEIIPVYTVHFESPDKIPERKENTIYIVSRLIKTAFPDREDFLVPYNLVRAPNGAVVGCKGFAL